MCAVLSISFRETLCEGQHIWPLSMFGIYSTACSVCSNYLSCLFLLLMILCSLLNLLHRSMKWSEINMTLIWHVCCTEIMYYVIHYDMKVVLKPSYVLRHDINIVLKLSYILRVTLTLYCYWVLYLDMSWILHWNWVTYLDISWMLCCNCFTYFDMTFVLYWSDMTFILYWSWVTWENSCVFFLFYTTLCMYWKNIHLRIGVPHVLVGSFIQWIKGAPQSVCCSTWNPQGNSLVKGMV